MDIQTLNEEEFEKLHPSMKEYLLAGIDTNPYGDKIVTEKNFFNMDLFNNDPYNLDPDLPQRTEKLRETDYYALSDVTMSSDMTTYRQALRDLPSNYTTNDSGDLKEDLSNLNWPTKP